MSEETRYTRDELAALTGVSRWTILKYLRMGWIPPVPAHGPHAYYTGEHLTAIRRLQEERAARRQPKKRPGYTLGELAAASGLPPRTIAYYRERGLLNPPVGRTKGAYYTEDHLARLKKIVAAKHKNKTFTQLGAEIRATYPWAFPHRTDTDLPRAA